MNIFCQGVAVLDLKQLEIEIESFRMLGDEEVLRMIEQGNSLALEFLIYKYKHLVRTKSQTYFLIGGEKEDIIQEGLIGLYKAICNFNAEKISSFRQFADLCITRQIITAIKAATRQKHIPLNSYVSLDKPIYDEDSSWTLIDTIAESKAIDPQIMLINHEKLVHIELHLLESLSEFERRVLYLYMDGFTYQEISEELKRHVKSIDNAIQRIKRKLETVVLKERELTV